MALEVADSARKHGITDADIVHGVRMQLRAVRQSADRTFLIGADRTGRLLELVLLDATEVEPACVIHAMELRPKFYDFLKRGDDDATFRERTRRGTRAERGLAGRRQPG